MWNEILGLLAKLFCFVISLLLAIILLLIASCNAVAQGTERARESQESSRMNDAHKQDTILKLTTSPPPTATTYYGTATMDVWYKGIPYLNIPPQQKRYQQSVKVEIGPPLHGNLNVELNPFHYQATTSQSAEPGSFVVNSADLYLSDEGYTAVFQYWEYFEQGGSYQGTYRPGKGHDDNFNMIVTEDVTGYFPFCGAAIEPERSTIDITFDENRVTTKVAGTVYDPLIQQLCVSCIERFEISINASYSPDDDLPNLTPYKPTGWSDKIVVSTTTGTTTDSTPLSVNDTLYVDFAVINDSSVPISTKFYHTLYVDGVEKKSWYTDSLQAGNYTYVPDYSIGKLSAGTHQLTIVIDTTNAVPESNEQDNTYTKTISVVDNATPVALEQGQTTIDHDWKTVMLSSTFQDPVVIVGPPTYHGGQPGVVRVRNVAGDSFEVRFQEWLYLDGSHAQETLPYLVLEKGRHEMEDGSIWEAGTFFLDGTGEWSSQPFTASFSGQPTLILTGQTFNSSEPVVVRAKNVSADGFDAALFEEEAKMDGHVLEEVGYLAIYNPNFSGSVSVGGTATSYILQSQAVNHRFTPVLSHALKVEEEQSKDTETSHTDETISVLVLADKLFAQITSFNGADTATLRRLAPEYSSAMEWGTVNGVTHKWLKVPLVKQYTNPIVVVKPVSNNGGDPGVIRLRNVAGNSFELRYNEWLYLDGFHTVERIFFLVAEEGEQTLAGLTVEAGRIDSSMLINDGWELIDFYAGFSEAPAVFTSVQTYNGGDPLTTRLKNITWAGFNVTMDEEEAKRDGHMVETIGWIAVQQGSGRTSDNRSFQVLGDSTNHTPHLVNFGQSFDRRLPVLISEIASTNGGDPCVLRYQNLGSNSVELFLQEEQSLDAETSHVMEGVSLFVAE